MEVIVPELDQNLLTRQEAAKTLRVSLPTLDKLIASTTLHSVKVRRRRFICQTDITEFIRKGGSNG